MNFIAAKARVTLRDVAHRLKVSHTTISRALRNDPRISAPMRERVQQAAAEMGHRPDPLLSALAQYRHGKRTKTISAELAWINQWPDAKQLHSFQEFELYWQGARAEADRCGFRLEEFKMHEQISPARLEKILRTRNIRGILLPPHGGIPLNWADFHWEDFSIVRFGRSIPAPRAHVVTSDQVTDGIIAFENIWRHGYRRIGLAISGQTHTRFGAGYWFSQMNSSPTVKLPALVLTQARGEAVRRQLKSWLNKHRPDAVLTDLVELRSWLENVGCKVPQDIGLAALSVLDGNADAGIDQNSKEIGKAAVQLLISLVNHNECGIPKICRELLIEGSWVDGSTLPPKKRV